MPCSALRRNDRTTADVCFGKNGCSAMRNGFLSWHGTKDKGTYCIQGWKYGEVTVKHSVHAPRSI